MNFLEKENQLGWQVLTCLLFAGLADILFYKEGLGWTVGIYTFVIISGLLIFNPYFVYTKPGKVTIAINIALVFALIENLSGLTFFLSFLGITSIALLSNPVWRQNAWLWLKGTGNFWAQNILRVFRDVKIFKTYFQGENRLNIQFKNWILPFGLSLIFVSLIAGANPILTRLWNLIDWDWIVQLFAFERILLWSMVIILSWPLLRPRLRLHQQPLQEKDFKNIRNLIQFLFSKESILYSLVLFNLIFLVQTSMDLIYLWGGMALPEGMTYAEYSHRGAYPLIATALLAGSFVLVALRPGSETEKVQSIRVLVYFWVGQNVLLVLASIWRTTLYIEEYSLTYLRLAALIWMGLVALGLIWIVLRILLSRSNTWLINMNGVSLLTVLMGCAFINFGSVIAQFNVEHSKEVTGKGQVLDLKYLREIGTASLPALRWFQQHSNQYNYKMSHALKLERKLRNVLSHELGQWRTWTFRSYRLAKNASALGEIRASLPPSVWTIVSDKSDRVKQGVVLQ